MEKGGVGAAVLTSGSPGVVLALGRVPFALDEITSISTSVQVAGTDTPNTGLSHKVAPNRYM